MMPGHIVSPTRSGRVLVGRSIVSFVALFTAVSAHVADWSASHVLNPNWPPHAKFHNGQTLAFAIAACLACLWFTWRLKGEPGTNAAAAIVLAALYWVTQAAAILYPGTAFFDPGIAEVRLSSLPIQVVIEIVALLLLAVAAHLLLWPSARTEVAGQ